MAFKPSLTIEEKISLVLLDNLRYVDDFEVPPAVTQEGLAVRTNTARPNIARSLKKMEEKGAVFCRLAHIRGHRRRKKAYFMEPGAVTRAEKLKERLGGLKVKYGGKEEKLMGVSGRTGTSVLELYLTLNEELEVGEGIGRKTEDAIGPVLKQPGRTSDTKRPFIGRDDELRGLGEWGKDKNCPVMVVHGLAGMGKTTLAAEFIGSYVGGRKAWFGFVEGGEIGGELHHLVLVLRSSKVPCPNLERVASGDIRSAGPMDISTSLVLDLSSERGTLLVLDDLHLASEQMKSALGALVRSGMGGFKLLATSRARGGFYTRRDVISGGRVREIHLHGLDERSALSILERKGVDRITARSVYERCSGHPMVLDLLSMEGERAIDPEKGDMPTDVDDFFREEIIQGLTGGQLRAAKFISVFRLPLARGSEVLRRGNINPHSLDWLADNSILVRGGGSFTVHRAIRGAISDRIDGETWREFNSLAADHYLRDKEDLNSVIEAAYHLSCAQRYGDLVELLRRRGNAAFREGFLELMMVLDTTDTDGLEGNELGWYHYISGLGRSMIGEPEEAIFHLEKAERMGSKKDLSLFLGIHECTGRAFLMKGDPQRAFDRFEIAVKVYEGMDKRDEEDDRKAISSMNGLGMAKLSLSDIDGALAEYDRASRAARSGSFPDLLAAIEFNRATAYAGSGRVNDASLSVNKALMLSREMDDPDLEFKSLVLRGTLESKEGCLEKALCTYDEAIELVTTTYEMEDAAQRYLDIGDRYVRSRLDRGLAERLKEFVTRGQTGGARQMASLYNRICSIQQLRGEAGSPRFHDGAYDIFIGMGMKRMAAKAKNNLSVVQRDSGDLEGALESCRNAISLLERSGDRRGKALTLLNEGILLLALDRDSEAQKVLKEAKGLFRELGIKDMEKKARELLRNT